jgi:DNA-binding transcriptional LysR family regulator
LGETQVFYYVGKVGNFSRVGKLSRLSQSSLSMQNLGDKLDCQLFIRQSKGLLLTEKEKILFRACKQIPSLQFFI